MKKGLIYFFTATGFASAIIPLFFYVYCPEKPWIGRYGIPLFIQDNGELKTLYWIDFAILTILCWTLALLVYKIRSSRKKNLIQS